MIDFCGTHVIDDFMYRLPEMIPKVLMKNSIFLLIALVVLLVCEKIGNQWIKRILKVISILTLFITSMMNILLGWILMNTGLYWLN